MPYGSLNDNVRIIRRNIVNAVLMPHFDIVVLDSICY